MSAAISTTDKLHEIYPVSLSIGDAHLRDNIDDIRAVVQDIDSLPEELERLVGGADRLGYLPDLARLELAVHKARNTPFSPPAEVGRFEINPTVSLLELSWKNLSHLLDSKEDAVVPAPEPVGEIIMLWRHPGTGDVRFQAASDEDLLVLKMIVEEIDPKEAARAGNLPPAVLDDILYRTAEKGIMLKPRSRLRRDPVIFGEKDGIDDSFLTASAFTLQWHITQTCDLHCKHCYDRSDRSFASLGQALGILDDLYSFCKSRHVRGQVSFSGGNPLLYPHFTEVYRAAADLGFTTAILGNPSPREKIEELISIQMPVFFQVSLEGLPEHNDRIRGAGHFDQSMEFLRELRDIGVSTMVMLTLTKDNVDQVLPLAEMLRGLVDDFHFNRLSAVGEGANLALPTPDRYRAFLDEYLQAAGENPIMGIKDNLINIIHHARGLPYFGGCTGFGCGAAFNFISLLSDGEAHACRKFPSPIGNVHSQGIAGVYDSVAASRYREGCAACRSCRIRPVCGGCLAVSCSRGINFFEEKDPFCFIS